MSVDILLRLAGMIVLGAVGWWIGLILNTYLPITYTQYIVAALGACLGVLAAPALTIRPVRWIGERVRQLPTHELLAGTVGLVVGLLIAVLLAVPLSMLPDPFGRVLPLVGSLVFAYLGITVMLLRHKDLLEMVGRAPSTGSDGKGSKKGNYVILDTSAIIDGRIADISHTGFITGTMLIPRFVLNELQHIADSADVLRRNRGRRGLDMLNKLQKDSTVPIQITEVDAADEDEVDAKLVKLAKGLSAAIVTNDFNLNRVAELQGIRVLNINELANAVKPVVLPGEDLRILVIQEGKEIGQGVGYLDDGTMVVIENGRRYIGEELEVTVTRVLQTVAGRMIFAHLKVD
jgi:uncharacterized protein YacL